MQLALSLLVLLGKTLLSQKQCFSSSQSTLHTYHLMLRTIFYCHHTAWKNLHVWYHPFFPPLHLKERKPAFSHHLNQALKQFYNSSNLLVRLGHPSGLLKFNPSRMITCHLSHVSRELSRSVTLQSTCTNTKLVIVVLLPVVFLHHVPSPLCSKTTMLQHRCFPTLVTLLFSL